MTRLTLTPSPQADSVDSIDDTLVKLGCRDDIGWESIISELKLVCELGASGIEREIEWAVEEDPEFIRAYDF